MTEAQYTFAPWMPHSFIISGDGGRPLLTIHPDGTVTGEIEDASEAARVFVDYVRQNIRQPTPADAQVAALIEALRELIRQVRISDAIDAEGHGLTNLKAFLDAEQALTAFGGQQ